MRGVKVLRSSCFKVLDTTRGRTKRNLTFHSSRLVSVNRVGAVH